MKISILLIFIFVAFNGISQNGSVGINTTSPNPNAALHITSSNGDQGLLIPSLTTAQRNSLNLESTENGLIVFDLEIGTFFYWNNGVWNSFMDGVIDNDSDASNEIQDLDLTGDDLTITGNGSATTIDLSVYTNTDTQLTEAQVDAFANNNGYLTTEVDGSITNEIQDLDLTGDDLTITGNGSATTIDLSVYTNTDTQLTEAQVDAFANNNGYLTSFTEVDGSITNEIQDLDLTGDDLTITGNGSATTIDLSGYTNTDTQLTEAQVDAFANNNGYLTSFTEVDGSITNEIQDLDLTGDDLTITGNGSATTIDLSVYTNTDTQLTEAQVDAFANNNGYLTTEVDGSITNEIQDLDLTGDDLTITGNGSATTIDLSVYTNTDTQLTEAQVDAFANNNGYLTTEVDGSITNEIQDLDLTGDDLTITGNGSATTIDLSVYTNTDTQLTEAQVDAFANNNGYLTSFTEVDGSITNEIQDLDLTGDDLTITGNGSATTIDLSVYTNTDTQLTEAQVDAFANNNGYLTTEVDGSITNEIQDLDLTGDDLTITGNGSATTIDLSVYTNTDTQLTEAQVDAFANNNGYLSTEVDGSITNEIQDLDLTGDDLTITGNGSATTIDLSVYTNTDTQLTEAQVDAFANNNGYLTSFTEVDGSITNEIQDLDLTGDDLTITGNGSATTIDLSVYTNTDTQLTEAQVDAFANNNGYLTTEVDGSITNEIQDLDLTGDDLTITGNGSATTIDLSVYTNTDTQLTEAQVDAFANNNGYLTSFTEVDGSITNEIQDLDLTGDDLTITGNGSATTIDLSVYTNTDTQLTEAQVDAFANNNGYLTSFTEVDGSITNEIQDLDLTGDDLTITGNGSATTIDLSVYTNTDTQLTEAQVDAFANNNGYLTSFTEVDGSITNEIQDLDLTGDDLTITGNGSATTIDLSVYTNTDTQLTEAQVDAFANNNGYLTTEVDGSITNEIQDLDLTGDDLTITGNGSATTIDLSVYTNTDTQLTEAQVDAFANNNGYLTTEIDGSITNEIQDLDFTASVITLTGDPTATLIDLSNYDTDVTDDFDGDYLSLTSLPALGALALLDEVTSTEITDATITETDLNTSVAGDGLTGGAGTSLSVDLTASSGLQLTGGQLELGPIGAVVNTFSFPATEYVNSISVDAYGRVVNVGSGTPVLVSDRRLKNTIDTLSNSLENLMSIDGYSYFLNSDSLKTDRQYGVIAQEIESVFPELIIQREDGFLAVDYQGLIPVLVMALKEQQVIIDSLKQEVQQSHSDVENVNTKVDLLESRLNSLLEKLKIDE